jgi:hypothetical protein
VRDPVLAEHLAVPVLERDARAGVGAVADADRRLVLRELLHLDDDRRGLRRARRIHLDRCAFEQAELQDPLLEVEQLLLAVLGAGRRLATRRIAASS